MGFHVASSKVFLAFASLSGMFAVLAGAFMAHGLPYGMEVRALELLDIAVDYQFYHSFALLAVGLMCKTHRVPNKILDLAGFSLSFGIILFCGSLYVQNLTLIGLPNFLTPLGGLLLILGWAFIFLASFFQQKLDV